MFHKDGTVLLQERCSQEVITLLELVSLIGVRKCFVQNTNYDSDHSRMTHHKGTLVPPQSVGEEQKGCRSCRLPHTNVHWEFPHLSSCELKQEHYEGSLTATSARVNAGTHGPPSCQTLLPHYA